ncbi:uncharacterized protein J4E88_005187 [Alternaria novae-zelandiae]|uniref:uncharacterized protein n=1 Tax=Alternaria novae-zelandiae TaxID=430562 RepID=UPI0020C336CF|nr:uncharacterized protein J4E88_005187 [Alternaria novae-zelandiae]XP_051357130.1 uncharacterized protein J4E92_000199 [Alternaria infectoria]KAI4682297.1 hypothetical protein J4E88_005187 [Alternaria novae-zelandiae]KAI4938918.1 hypothetical protein J4E92_000199 [Alternaria infectoria]
MAHQNELKEIELQVPDHFKACEALLMQIDTFPEEFLNGKLTPENFPSVCQRSAKLLEDMKAALSEARTKVSVENKHMWVEHWTWMQLYEEGVATMEQINNKLHGPDRREMILTQLIVVRESADRTTELLKRMMAAMDQREKEAALAPVLRDDN